MKVTFYGSIAIAAIAADQANAVSLEDDTQIAQLAETNMVPTMKAETGSELSSQALSETEAETSALASIDSEAAANSDSWSDLDSDSDADADSDADSMSDSLSEGDSASEDDEDFDLAQTEVAADACAETCTDAARMCVCIGRRGGN